MAKDKRNETGSDAITRGRRLEASEPYDDDMVITGPNLEISSIVTGDGMSVRREGGG